MESLDTPMDIDDDNLFIALAPPSTANELRIVEAISHQERCERLGPHDGEGFWRNNDSADVNKSRCHLLNPPAVPRR